MGEEIDVLKSPSACVFRSECRAQELWDAMISSGRTLSVADRFSLISTVERLQRVLEIDWQRKSNAA